MLHVESPQARSEARTFLLRGGCAKHHPKYSYFNHLEGNSRCFCQDVAEMGVFLTPPIFPDTPALFLMTVGAVGGQRAVDVISIIFPPTGRIPPPVSQEIQHFENIKSIDCSVPATRRRQRRQATAIRCSSLTRFLLQQLCSAVFFRNCQIAIVTFIIISFGDRHHHKHDSSCSFI